MSDVNFTPNRGAYKELTPFRYWCQKVLPLVYDDSISYYELLCKVVNYLNITMEDVGTLNDDVTAMYTAYDELQDFVNQYFTDLNIQTQIDNKLDRMAADGSLNALIDPLVIDTTETSVANTLPGVVNDQLPDVVEDQIDNVVGEQIDGVVADQIQSAADNWLGVHISGSNALDSTLTLYNAAARSMSAGNLIDTYAKYLGAENRITAFAAGFWENDNGIMVHPSETNLAYMSAAITVNPGDKYTIIAPAFIDVYSYVPRYAFTDSSYNVISVSDAAEQGAINKTITAPAGATKFIVNDNLVVDPNVDTRFSKMLLVKGELTGTNEISDLKADLNEVIELIDSGIIPDTKEVSWITAYVDTNGNIRSSSASKTGLVTLNAGDMVKVGTRNENITIIGTTTASSIAVGDRITPIQITSPANQYEEYSYTATATINIVICVRASQYNLEFYKPIEVYRAVQKNTADINEINPLVDILSSQNFVKVTRPLVVNGMLDTTTGERTYNLSQVNSYCITPDLLHVAKGSSILKTSAVTMRVYFYNADGSFINYTQIGTGATKYNFSNECYIRLFFLVSGGTNEKTVYDNVTFALILYGYEPYTTLTFLGLSGEAPNIHTSTSGEASIIQFSNGEVMEIDFHRNAENNYQYYRDALALRGVRNLDYLVFTHWHDDHWGLFETALTNNYIKIDGATAFLPQELTDELVTARGWESYKAKQDEITAILQEHNCTIVRPQVGDILKVDDTTIEWYNCDHTIYNTSGEYYSTNYNDWSLCFNMRKGNTVVNYTADLGPVGQRYNAGKMPKCDILKAMHHGWDNGVNNLIPAFINNISPDMVIAENGYEHRPNTNLNSSISNAKSPIYSWAEANGVPAYPTNLNGNIDVIVNKYGYRLKGHYTRFIRNDKNWSYNDNSEHIES